MTMTMLTGRQIWTAEYGGHWQRSHYLFAGQWDQAHPSGLSVTPGYLPAAMATLCYILFQYTVAESPD